MSAAWKRYSSYIGANAANLEKVAGAHTYVEAVNAADGPLLITASISRPQIRTPPGVLPVFTENCVGREKLTDCDERKASADMSWVA